MNAADRTVAVAATAVTPYRYFQLGVGVICMVMIANLQYGWNLFVNPIDEQYHWGRASIQWAFSIFVFTETWLVPVEGWFVDRFGPALVVALGGILVAIAWVIDSLADSLAILYVAAVLSGIGAGAVYGTCVGNALKWFADRRGFASGLTAAGFGAGAAATVVPVREFIAAYGYQSAFFWFGIGQGLLILVLSCLLKAPAPGQATASRPARLHQSSRSHTPREMLRMPLFWVLYVMFVLVAAPGLALTAQLASVAADFGVANRPVAVLGMAGTALTLALFIDNILNGLARPCFGWVSDHIGREPTMFMVFGIGAVGIWSLGAFGREPVMFVLLSALVYFTWGEIYSLFPATCTDAFGAG
ncbi:MAG TPA: oxalate/formate MFS antiporter, partial [Candidatus Sulfotelmatobacter sp.]|nr:oxalate/formate MFS antiporter [Candidatus Sulfotelmatobacter sp.]